MSAVTGGHDLCVEIDAHLLAQALRKQLGDRRVGSLLPRPGATDQLRFDTTLQVTHVEVRSANGAQYLEVNLVLADCLFSIHQGGVLVRQMPFVSGAATFGVPLSIGADPATKTLVLQVNLQDAVGIAARSLTLQNAADVDAFVGGGFDAQKSLLSALLLAMLLQGPIKVPLSGLVLDPAFTADDVHQGLAASPPALRLTKAELHFRTTRQTGYDRGSLSLLGTLWPSHGAGAGAARKTEFRASTSLPLAFSIAPDMLREVLCRKLRDALGTSDGAMCPMCGPAQSTKVLEASGVKVYLDGVGMSFGVESIELGAALHATHAVADGNASMTAGVTCSLDAANARIVPQVAVKSRHLSVQADGWLVFLTGGVAAGAAKLLEGYLRARVDVLLQQYLGMAAAFGGIQLPTSFGDVPVTYRELHVDPHGIHVAATIPASAFTVTTPALVLEEKSSTVEKIVGQGYLHGVTCINKAYPYEDAHVQITTVVTPRLVGVSGPMTWEMWIEGQPVPQGSSVMSFQETAADFDNSTKVATVNLLARRTADGVELQNVPSQGSFSVNVLCVAEAAGARHAAMILLHFEGKRRYVGGSLAQDQMQCIQRKVTIERVFPWPASDPPGWDISEWWWKKVLPGLKQRKGPKLPWETGIPGIPGKPGEPPAPELEVMSGVDVRSQVYFPLERTRVMEELASIEPAIASLANPLGRARAVPFDVEVNLERELEIPEGEVQEVLRPIRERPVSPVAHPEKPISAGPHGDKPVLPGPVLRPFKIKRPGGN